MRKLYVIIALLAPIFMWAQQDIQFTQFQFNRLFYNPGVAGSGGGICVTGMHRSQYVGFEGAPTSQSLNASVPIKFLKGGISVDLVSDQIGFYQNVNAGLGYAFQLNLGEGTLGFGIRGMFRNTALISDQWITPDNGFGGGVDVSIPQGDASAYTLDMDFGAYYLSRNLYAGFSMTRLVEPTSAFTNTPDLNFAQIQSTRHYFFMAGYTFELASSNWALQPNIMTKTSSFSIFTTDINLSAIYNNKIWGGVTYRTEDAVAVNIGYQFTEKISAGYSYDVGISDVSSASGGSHELFLRYCFTVEIPPRKKGSYKNIRFL